MTKLYLSDKDRKFFYIKGDTELKTIDFYGAFSLAPDLDYMKILNEWVLSKFLNPDNTNEITLNFHINFLTNGIRQKLFPLIRELHAHTQTNAIPLQINWYYDEEEEDDELIEDGEDMKSLYAPKAQTHLIPLSGEELDQLCKDQIQGPNNTGEKTQ